MAHEHLKVRPGRQQDTVFSEDGSPLTPPEDWEFLPAGDAAITRKVKERGPTWVVTIKKGRRTISQGIWASKDDIAAVRDEVAILREDPAFIKKKAQTQARRRKKEHSYIEEFHDQILAFLNFHARYQDEAEYLAREIADYAAPIGSGTVARTERIPVEQRAERAVIAWMRHKTTAYDTMKIARVRGRRREVRRDLALISRQILAQYRKGADRALNCPLKKAIDTLRQTGVS